MSAIGAGIELKKNGFESFVVLEEKDELGGTWRDNTYPGVAVDIPSISYFKLLANHLWEIRGHLEEVQDQDDRAELERILLLASERNAERKACQACEVSVAEHGFVCESHYHDYALCWDEGCWTCYVSRVFKLEHG